MAIAVTMSFVGAALLLAAGALGDLLGPWALVIALPLVAVAVWLLAHSLPLVLMSARLRPLQLGPTVIRSARRLSEDEEWELFRLVDLVKGRLWATAPGAECGGCEVWVLAHRRDAERLSRARCIGVGIVGPAVCAVPAAHLRDGEAVLRAIAAGVAANAAATLNGRVPAFLRLGLRGYLLCCALHAEGPDRNRCLHEAAHHEAPRGIDIEALLRRLAPSLRAGTTLALGQSLVGFLVHRYGWRSFLTLLRHADAMPIELALFETYGRTVGEIEKRWLVFLEGSLVPLTSEFRQSA